MAPGLGVELDMNAAEKYRAGWSVEELEQIGERLADVHQSQQNHNHLI